MQLTGFEPRPSDVRSDCSTNRAITTAQRVNFDIYYLQFNYSRVTRLGNVDVVSLTDDETAVGLVIVANFRHFNGADVFFLVSARFEPSQKREARPIECRTFFSATIVRSKKVGFVILFSFEFN